MRYKKIVAEIIKKRNVGLFELYSRSKRRDIAYARMDIARELHKVGYTNAQIGYILHKNRTLINYYLNYAKKEINL